MTDDSPFDPTTQLKPERIQAELRSDDLARQLQTMPGWGPAARGPGLERTFLFPSLNAAVAFVQMTVALGEALDFVPEIDLRYQEVTLRVATDVRRGPTQLDVDMAKRFGLVLTTHALPRRIGRHEMDGRRHN